MSYYDKNLAIQKLMDSMAKRTFGITVREALEKRICVQCKEPALVKCYSQAGRREYWISGLCEPCFDAVAQEDDL